MAIGKVYSFIFMWSVLIQGFHDNIVIISLLDFQELETFEFQLVHL